jgi:hypothetical protein
VRDHKKLFGSKKIKTLVLKKIYISYTEIYFNCGLDIFYPKYSFLIRQRGDRNALARHSKASKKIFQTEIDFDLGTRLPLGAAIQNMNPFRAGLRFIDGCFRVYLGLV